MTSIDFRPAAYDAVAAFYAPTHIPRAEHARLLRRIASWLRPGGLLVATMSAGYHPDAIEDDFLGMGAPMFVSHFDAATNRRLVKETGLRLRRDDIRVQEEDGRRVAFLWIVAEKPR